MRYASGDKLKNSCGNVLLSHYLKDHINYVHEGVKNSKCEICGKAFRDTGTLKIHMKNVHEGVKNYKCDSCCKSFKGFSGLRYHIKSVHEGI